MSNGRALESTSPKTVAAVVASVGAIIILFSRLSNPLIQHLLSHQFNSNM